MAILRGVLPGLLSLGLLAAAAFGAEAQKPEPGTVEKDGLSVTAKAAKDSFGSGEALAFDVTFKNVSKNAFQLFDIGFWMYEVNTEKGTWQCVLKDTVNKKDFTPVATVRPMMARIGQPVTLEPDKTRTAKVILGRALSFAAAGARPGLNAALPDGTYVLALTLNLTKFTGETLDAPAAKDIPFWTGTVSLETAPFKVGGAAAKVEPAAETKLFADEAWYKQQAGAEQQFTGVLKAIPQDPNVATTLQRTSLYSLGDRTIYTGAKKVDALDKLVDKKVVIRGKAVDMNLEGQNLKEVWPGAVRAADAAVQPLLKVLPPGKIRSIPQPETEPLQPAPPPVGDEMHQPPDKIRSIPRTEPEPLRPQPGLDGRKVRAIPRQGEEQ